MRTPSSLLFAQNPVFKRANLRRKITRLKPGHSAHEFFQALRLQPLWVRREIPVAVQFVWLARKVVRFARLRFRLSIGEGGYQ